MAEINVIPLVDIMLVLLVIFIITAPLLTHAVKIDLPRASSTPNEIRADNIQFAIDKDGQMFWDGEPIDRTQMLQRFAAAGQRSPTPELHLRVDRAARYETLADAMSEAGKAGIDKLGFVTDPSGNIAPATTTTQ
jgi:biopolymer transport protein ExbD